MRAEAPTRSPKATIVSNAAPDAPTLPHLVFDLRGDLQFANAGLQQLQSVLPSLAPPERPPVASPPVPAASLRPPQAPRHARRPAIHRHAPPCALSAALQLRHRQLPQSKPTLLAAHCALRNSPSTRTASALPAARCALPTFPRCACAVNRPSVISVTCAAAGNHQRAGFAGKSRQVIPARRLRDQQRAEFGSPSCFCSARRRCANGVVHKKNRGDRSLLDLALNWKSIQSVNRGIPPGRMAVKFHN